MSAGSITARQTRLYRIGYAEQGQDTSFDREVANGLKRAAERERTVWIVPTALKYRFVDGADPMPVLERTMDRLEAQFSWWPRDKFGLIERIY